MEIKVLDCTLRDGGYVNNWNFGKDNINRILVHLNEAEIDIIECGFLSNKKKTSSDSSVFNSIEEISDYIPKNRQKRKYVCMINYGEYRVEDIPDFDGTSVDGIRVVFHKIEAKDAIEFCKKLSKKGYMLFIQPMVTINYSDIELLELVQDVNLIKPYAFYIVDSFGVMKKNDLLRMFYLVDNNLDKTINIGYHAHNNLQLAYSNAQALVDVSTERTRIIDSSVFGMGRGAGNLNTELFIQYLNDYLNVDYKVYPLLQIIDETLNKIYASNYWGYSLPHYLSSTCNCHPNYATYLADKNTLSVKSINEILSKITVEKKDSFDKDYIEELYLNYQKHYIDDKEAIFSLRKEFRDKGIVVIAPGSSIERYSEEISSIINNKDTVVISVNFIPNNFRCDFTFVSNSKRFERLIESEDINLKERKLIITSNINSDNYKFINVNYVNLLNDINLVEDNATLMLLKLLLKTNVKKVYLAGFDGYSYDNNQNYANKEMVFTRTNKVVKSLNRGVAEVLRQLSNYIKLEFITPTKYK